jgi:enoyl-CoA hydratase
MSSLRLDREDPLAIVRLDKARGNAIDEPLVDELLDAIARIAADSEIRGVLLASAHPKLFCPGLDLLTLSEYDRPALTRFIHKFGDLVHALYGLEKPIVAALSGHAIAGGCILALTADWRVLRRGAQVGLNEVKVGVPLPWSVALLLRDSVSPRALTQCALLGSNFVDDAALAAGLADELADADTLGAMSMERLGELAEKDASAFGLTKRYLRARTLEAMKAHEHRLSEDFVDAWFSDTTQTRIREIAASLGRKG